MKAIGYKRLSQQEQSNFSLEGQDRAIREYCTRNNLTLVNIFEDNGENSYTFDRKAFTLLERELKGVQYLVVYHLDRFSRNMAEAMIKIKQYLERGIRVRDITEPLNLDDEDPNTFLLRSMKFMVAESELHRIKQRTKAGLVNAAMSGRFTSTAPYGYQNARDDRNKPILVIDDEEASIVRIIFREYLNGMRLEDLKRLAHRYGCKLQGKSSMQRVLANPVYAGMIKVPATKNKPSHLVPGLQTAIISTQDYWLVQEKLLGKSIIVHNRDEVPLRGVLHCWCGRKMTAGNSKGNTKYYWYYVCKDHPQNLSAIKLHTQFNLILDNLSFDPANLAFLKSVMLGKLKNFLNGREERMNEIRKQLSMTEGKIRILEEKYLRTPDISEATYRRIMSEFKSDQSRFYKELAAANTNEQAYFDKLEAVLFRMTNIRAEFERMSTEKKHQFVNIVFNQHLSYEDGAYRTNKLHDLFFHNAVVLKEKGLLIINSPVRKMGEIPVGTPGGSPVELMEQLLAIFAA